MGILEKFSLEGKVIVVTGGTGVLGSSFIDAIVEAGGSVAIMGRKKEVAEEKADQVIKKGGKAIAIVADVLNETQLLSAKEQVLAGFGKIDGLVNGAGGNIPEAVLQNDQSVFALNIEGMRKAADLNLWGTIIPTQIFGAAIAANNKGSIVNISSMTSLRATTKILGYSIGKAGVDCYNHWFAVELANRYGDKIRMNSIAPGYFVTEQNRNLMISKDGGYTERGASVIQQTPFKRFGNPDELKGALVWLLSDASQFVTGTTINVDGGFSIFSGV